MPELKKDTVVEFTLAVITKQLQGIEKTVKGLETRLEKMEADANENYEELVERISNVSTPGGDFGVEY